MKDKLLEIFNNNFEIEEDNGRTFLHLPIYKFEDFSPKFIIELKNIDDDYFVISDIAQTVRGLQEEGVFTEDISIKFNELASKYRMTIESGAITARFEELEHIKYFASYMIQFISVISYLARNQKLENDDEEYFDDDCNE